MCGITGIWRLNNQKVSTQDISVFNDTLKHRGPDGSGIYIDENACLALGQRRLAIFDLSDAGRQPMSYLNGELQITYNGEIFNHVELKNELQAKGHRFATRTDTEVILAAYKEWGEDCLPRFNGMWAFAIWDTRKQTLFISRDRFGIKPLYYTYSPGQLFAFASESVAFGSLDGFTKEADEKNISLGLQNAYYLESVGKTIYRNIHKLLPGHQLTLKAGSPIKIGRWWNTSDHLTEVPASYPEQVEKFRELFYDSCKLRLRSDVPLGLTLSGGLDSSSVYATIQKLYKEKKFDQQHSPQEQPRAFIASFPGTTMDEKKYADEVIQFYNGTATYIYPDGNNISDSIIAEIKKEDFIFLTPPVVHNIYKEIKEQGIKVSMDGHGVDEMLFGYPWMIRDWMLQAKNAKSVSLFLMYAGMRNETGSSLGKAIKESSKIWKGYFAKKAMGNKWLQHPQIFEDLNTDRQSDAVNNIVYQSFHSSTLPTLLRNWDRASMRHGVEIRMPFMDWRLVSYVFSLPVESKVKNGFSKRILRDAMKGALPENIRTRKYKIGINAPMLEWFNGPMSAFITDAVRSASFLQSPIWNGPLLRDMAIKLCSEKKWTQRDCDSFWPYLNAWILMN